MEEFCDLHVHSTYSDGTLTPRQIVELAKQIGLSAVALTDHNTVAGLPEFMAAGEELGVYTIPGIEFSTDYKEYELHIVGLFIKPEDYAAVQALADKVQENKRKSNLALARALNRAGYDIRYEDIKARMPEGEPNRALFAAELTRLGYTSSVQDAFDRLLSPKHGYYKPPKRIDALEAIDFIKSIGGVAVLAHPFLSIQDTKELCGFLEQAVQTREVGRSILHRLDGMEVLYPKFTAGQTVLAKTIADAFRLRYSGGSDFHGENKPDIALGKGKGDLYVPISFMKSLRRRSR